MRRIEIPEADAPSLAVPVSRRDHIQGPSTAPLTLVEYGDYECQYCGAAYPEVKRLQAALTDTLCFVFRNFPLTQIHPHAMLAAEVAEGAGLQRKFWEMHDTLFEYQEEISTESIAQWALDLNLDLNKIESDIEHGPVRKKIREDRMSGIRSGVNGTPTFFINGRRYNGVPDFESLLDALQAELA